MADRAKEFDDINMRRNGEQDEERPPARSNSSGGGLQNALRVLSVLPCFPSYQPKPDTPNIEQLKTILAKFKREDPNQTDVSVVDRLSATELSNWTQKLLTYLPSVDELPESEQTRQTVTHFKTIKTFYNAFQSAGFDPTPEMETFFNSLQIYECVMSIAFVIFDEHPDVMRAITEQVTKAISEIQGFNMNGCCAMALCGLAILSRFNTILGVLDQKLGELGLVRVAEFITNIIEVFCRFFHIDLRDTEKIASISESIQDMSKAISSALRAIFGDSIPGVERKKKWGPLAITERIRAKLNKFENKSPIVERTCNSFEKFFKTVETIDDNFEKFKVKNENRMQAAQTLSASPGDGTPEDQQRIESRPLMANQIADKQFSAHEEIIGIGRVFQHLETILSYGILIFKNEDEILNPLLDHVDECTRIMDKFAKLHPLYKILCGTNFLSKMKVVVKKIVALLESSKLKVNSPKEFLTEFKQRYPDLLYLLCESYLNDNLKKKLEFLPDSLENSLNNALDGALSKFKNKFKF